MFFNDPAPTAKGIYSTISLVLLSAIFAASCKYDKEELLNPGTNNQNSCSTVSANFSTDIMPLVTTKCAVPGCHDATASGGHFFQSYNDVNAAKNLIQVRVVTQKSMPPTGPLPQADIDKLKCWIESGAPNN